MRLVKHRRSPEKPVEIPVHEREISTSEFPPLLPAGNPAWKQECAQSSKWAMDVAQLTGPTHTGWSALGGIRGVLCSRGPHRKNYSAQFWQIRPISRWARSSSKNQYTIPPLLRLARWPAANYCVRACSTCNPVCTYGCTAQ